VVDNGSGYVWGKPEDLWRLWLVGGLSDSERMTYRNHILWDKPPSGLGDGQNNGGMRSYGIKSEHCLFFMLGEQGFNENADNYWEGWEPIRQYLKAQRDLMGWSSQDMKRIAGGTGNGHGDHWTGRSQWVLPTEDAYTRWQWAASNDDLKRDYDDLKRDYDDLKRDYDDLKRDIQPHSFSQFNLQYTHSSYISSDNATRLLDARTIHTLPSLTSLDVGPTSTI